jgi:hypothetical protein
MKPCRRYSTALASFSVFVLLGILIVQPPSSYTEPVPAVSEIVKEADICNRRLDDDVLILGFFLQSPQYNTLAEPDENIHNGKHHTLMKADEIALQIQHHVDSCVPEYLRKALAPELLDNRLRIQDMKFYQVGGAEYIVTGIGILVGALRYTVR